MRTVKFFVQRKHLTFLRGWFAWELQVGPLVAQWVHPEHVNGPSAQGRHLILFTSRIAGR